MAKPRDFKTALRLIRSAASPVMPTTRKITSIMDKMIRLRARASFKTSFIGVVDMIAESSITSAARKTSALEKTCKIICS